MSISDLLQLSLLERLLTEGHHSGTPSVTGMVIAEDILACLSIQSLAKLSQVNTRFHKLVDVHIRNRWNIVRFLSMWFSRPLDFLKIMETTNALVCGDNVTRFFRECVQHQEAIDICVNPNHAYQLSAALAKEGYQFDWPGGGGGGGIVTFDEALDAVVASYPFHQLYCDGERSTNAAFHGAHYFPFKRRLSRFSESVIVMRLVRCEPYRHILAQHSST